MGIVKDSTDTTTRVELHTSCQTISVEKCNIMVIGAPAKVSREWEFDLVIASVFTDTILSHRTGHTLRMTRHHHTVLVKLLCIVEEVHRCTDRRRRCTMVRNFFKIYYFFERQPVESILFSCRLMHSSLRWCYSIAWWFKNSRSGSVESWQTSMVVKESSVLTMETSKWSYYDFYADISHYKMFHSVLLGYISYHEFWKSII